MTDRLDSIRAYFPAEVTGAFLSAKAFFGQEDASYSNYMLYFFIALCVLNIVIYIRIYKVSNIFVLLFISIGFFLWAINIDPLRARDITNGQSDLWAPPALIFYSVLTTLLPVPQTKS